MAQKTDRTPCHRWEITSAPPSKSASPPASRSPTRSPARQRARASASPIATSSARGARASSARRSLRPSARDVQRGVLEGRAEARAWSFAGDGGYFANLESGLVIESMQRLAHSRRFVLTAPHRVARSRREFSPARARLKLTPTSPSSSRRVAGRRDGDATAIVV